MFNVMTSKLVTGYDKIYVMDRIMAPEEKLFYLRHQKKYTQEAM